MHQLQFISTWIHQICHEMLHNNALLPSSYPCYYNQDKFFLKLKCINSYFVSILQFSSKCHPCEKDQIQ